MPFKIVRNDITKMKVDAVVNTANSSVAVGSGVDEAIYRAAGWERLFKERLKIGPLRRGSAAITRGFRLPARYIIHVAGPKWDEAEPEQAKKQLRDCYDNVMSIALEKGLSSIAFPLIATGNHAFPKETGLDIAFTTISKYLYTSDIDVYLVVYDDEAFSLSKKLTEDIDEFIDSNYVDENRVTGRRTFRSSAGRMAQDDRMYSYGGLQSAGMAAPETEEADYDEAPVYMSQPAPMEKAPARNLKQYDSLDDILKNAGETFQERLFRYMDKSGMSDVEIYKGANLSKQTFSKLKKPGHVPKRETVMALAISMKLSIDDTKDLLESAGQAFSPSNKVDLVIQYCMSRGIYNIFEVERILFDKFGVTLVS